MGWWWAEFSMRIYCHIGKSEKIVVIWVKGSRNQRDKGARGQSGQAVSTHCRAALEISCAHSYLAPSS